MLEIACGPSPSRGGNASKRTIGGVHSDWQCSLSAQASRQSFFLSGFGSNSSPANREVCRGCLCRFVPACISRGFPQKMGQKKATKSTAKKRRNTIIAGQVRVPLLGHAVFESLDPSHSRRLSEELQGHPALAPIPSEHPPQT